MPSEESIHVHSPGKQLKVDYFILNTINVIKV